MSHSTVMVVIRDAKSATEAEERLGVLLAPFDENLEVEPTPVAVSDEEVGAATTFYRENPQHCDGEEGAPAKPFDEFVTDGNLEAWVEWTRQAVGAYFANRTLGAIYDAKEDTYSYLSSYNPKSRWDWWILGGRWHGFFQLKPGVTAGSRRKPYNLPVVGGERRAGEESIPEVDEDTVAILGPSGVFGDPEAENFEGRADLARKGDIDFEAMRTMAAQNADLTYDTFERVTKGIEPAPYWKDHVEAHMAKSGVTDETEAEERNKALTEARTSFHELPWNQALRAADLTSWFTEAREDWCIDTGGRSTFVERARNAVTSTFAMLVDGEWIEKGHMGWFGTASNEIEEDEWLAKQASYLNSLPDDTYLAIVDVHI